MQPRWTVKAHGDAPPLTVTVEVAHVTVATENGDQIAVTPEQLGPLVHRLDLINYDLSFGDS